MVSTLETTCLPLGTIITARVKRSPFYEAVTGSSYSKAYCCCYYTLLHHLILIIFALTRTLLYHSYDSKHFPKHSTMSSPIASPTAATASLKEQPSGPTCRFCEEYCEGSMIQPCSFCKDWWCIACLEGCFVRAAKDSRPFSPPWCCADIQLFRILDRLEPEIASLYRTRYREHMTRNKRWCPVPTCGAFIDVDTLANYHPTRSVTFQCPHCGGNVYNKGCRGIAHSSPCHEKDEAAMLAQYGIKQCPSCKQGVKRMFGCPLMECSCGAYFCWNCCKSPPDCDGGCDAQDSEIGSPNVPNVFVNEETVSVEDRDERKSPVDGTAGYNSPNAEYDDETDVFAKEDTISVEDRDRWATSRWSSPASRSRSSARSAGVSESETKSKGPLDGMRSPESQDDGGNSTAALNTESFSAAIDQTEREDSILKASNPGTKDTENSEADVVNTTAPKDQEDAIHGEVSLSVEETRHAGPETPDGRVLDLERSRGPSNPDAVNASTAQHLLRRIDTDSHPTGFESSIAQPTTNRLIDLDAGGFSWWANAPENFGADPGESPLSSRVQVWYCIHTPHFFALHWRVKGEYHGDPTPMECNRCVSRVRPMYLFDEDEEKRGMLRRKGAGRRREKMIPAVRRSSREN
jgi:hypothetical protein